MNWIAVSPKKAIMNNRLVDCAADGQNLLVQLYKAHINDYPKFYKMDILCKLSFVASELLLKEENLGEKRFEQGESRAVVLFNRVSSLHADTQFQKTIQNPDEFFPSPAIFVYTLPNITTGEIAIRNKYYGETSFYVLEDFNAEVIARSIISSFDDKATQSVLAGWVDCKNENEYKAILFIVNRQANIELLAAQLNGIADKI